MYAEGTGTPQDESQAVSWFRKAIALDSAPAMVVLSSLHWQGQGVPRDEREAYRLAEKAATYDEPAAFYLLVLCHTKDLG